MPSRPIWVHIGDTPLFVALAQHLMVVTGTNHQQMLWRKQTLSARVNQCYTHWLMDPVDFGGFS